MNQQKLLAGKRVLIVEDEPLIAIMVEDIVDELGCALRQTADNATHALHLIEAIRPDLAVIDVNLNFNPGNFAVADALAAQFIPFVFSSGHTFEDLPPQHCSVPVLSKPYGEAQLSDALQRLGFA